MHKIPVHHRVDGIKFYKSNLLFSLPWGNTSLQRDIKPTLKDKTWIISQSLYQS